MLIKKKGNRFLLQIQEVIKMSFYSYDEAGNIIPARKVVTDCQAAIDKGEKVIVEQNHKDKVDVNKIIAKNAGNMELIAKTAQMANFQYDDVTNNNFEEMMNQMIHAKETFNQVPSKIRSQFGNDPAKFMDFVHNKDNKDQLIEWGLMNAPEPASSPIEVVVTNPVETPQE